MKQPKVVRKLSRKYPLGVGILGVFAFILSIGFIGLQVYYLQRPTYTNTSAAPATGSLVKPCSPERALQCEKDGYKGGCVESYTGENDYTSYVCNYHTDQTTCTEWDKVACGSDTCVVIKGAAACFGSVGTACPADRLKWCLDRGFGDCKRNTDGATGCVYKASKKECTTGHKQICEERGYTKCEVMGGDFNCINPTTTAGCSEKDKAYCSFVGKPNCTLNNYGGRICSAGESTPTGMSVQMNKSWINRGESIVVSWQYPSSVNPEAADMFEILNNSTGAHVANLYPGSCTENPGAAPATTGSCTFSTANYGPGGYSIYFFKGNDHTNRIPGIEPVFTVSGSGGAGGSAPSAQSPSTQAPLTNPGGETPPTAVPTSNATPGNPAYQYHYDPNN